MRHWITSFQMVDDTSQNWRFAKIQSAEFRRAPLCEKAPESRRRLGHRVADVGDQRIDQVAVVRLGHDADHRLGAGGAHDDPAVIAEPRGRGGDRL